jgi:hypothetical protein
MWKKFWSNKKLRIIVLAVIAALLVTAATVIIIVNVTKDDEPDTPDYLVPDYEVNATPIEGEDPGEKLEAAEGGGAVSLIYYDQVTVDLSDNKVYLRFDNPSKSVNNMTLEISIKDTVLAKSGALQPGYRLTELPLQAGVAEKLAAGYAYVDGAKYTIYYYDPTTGERAIVNTEIPITVTVQE